MSRRVAGCGSLISHRVTGRGAQASDPPQEGKEGGAGEGGSGGDSGERGGGREGEREGGSREGSNRDGVQVMGIARQRF